MTYADVHFVLLVGVHGGRGVLEGSGCVECRWVSERKGARVVCVCSQSAVAGARINSGIVVAVVGLLLQGQGQGEEWSVTMGPERCTGVRLGERVVAGGLAVLQAASSDRKEMTSAFQRAKVAWAWATCDLNRGIVASTPLYDKIARGSD